MGVGVEMDDSVGVGDIVGDEMFVVLWEMEDGRCVLMVVRMYRGERFVV